MFNQYLFLRSVIGDAGSLHILVLIYDLLIMHDELCIVCPQTPITWLKTALLLVFANESFKL